jgi:hypothetical protein
MAHVMTQILAGLAVAAGYGVFLLVSPSTGCRRCSGGGRAGRRPRTCPRCGGTGRQFRLGARLVHRGKAAAHRYVREIRSDR